MMTDSSGNVIGQQAHCPYGEQWYAQNTTRKWLFTNYERDAESGNDYAAFRYNTSRLGRFASPDLLAGSPADPQSLNRYPYVRDDPANGVDPLGLLDNLYCDPDTECGNGGGSSGGGSGGGGGGGGGGDGGLNPIYNPGLCPVSFECGDGGGYVGYGDSAGYYSVYCSFAWQAGGGESSGQVVASCVEDIAPSSGPTGPGGGGRPPNIGPPGFPPNLPPGLVPPAKQPCAPSGSAPTPSWYEGLAESENFLGLGIDASGAFTEAANLLSFNTYGSLNAQNYGASPAYANYVYGVYLGASGSSLSTALSGANLYGKCCSSYTWGPGLQPDQTYTHIPAANVANITAGYNDQKNGTVCNPVE
jgi:RHS repeat-associated protein